MKNSVTTIQKSVMHLEHMPRVLCNPVIVERIGYIQNKTEVIERQFILPSVLFVFEGGGVMEEDGVRTELAAPFMIWNMPGDRRKYWPVPTWNELYIGFQEGSERDLQKYFNPEFFRLKTRTIARPVECRHHMTELLKAMASPSLPGAADRIDHLALLLLLETTYPQQQDHLSRNERIALEVSEYLHAHFQGDIDLPQVAEDHGWSYSTFQRQWRQKYSCSPIQYLRRLRNYEAINLLRESTLTIGDIARELGFHNQFYFAKFFRDMNGLPPSEFRQKKLEELKKK